MICLPALALVAALATPFEDVEQRFHLELPAGWQFAPQPGDTGGAMFRRSSDGVFINAAVRVMVLPAGTSLSAFSARVRAASESEPGYRTLEQRSCTVGGRPGECRRFVSLVNGDPKMSKIVQQAMVLASGRDARGAGATLGFVVHAETLAEAFPVFEADVVQLIAGFAPGPKVRGVAASHRPPRWRDLVGRWRSAAGHELVLTPAGTIVFGHRHGRFEIQGGNLIAHLDDGEAIFGIDVKPGRLTLSGGMFGEGELFVHAPAQVKARRRAPPH